MQKAGIAALLFLVAGASADSPHPPGLFDLPPSSECCVDVRSSYPDVTAGSRSPDCGQYVYEVWANTLRRVDRGRAGGAGYGPRQAGAPAAATRVSSVKKAGVYGIEFFGALVGTAVAGALGWASLEGIYQSGYNGPNSVPGGLVYFLTSAVLTAEGTHLTGKLVGHPRAFRRALLGGAIGGLAGGGAFVDYFVTRRNRHTVMIPIALVLPPLGAVIAYNLGG